MTQVLIVDGHSAAISAAIKKIMEQDINYICAIRDDDISHLLADNPSKCHGWYNKFNKKSKRDNLRLR